MPRLFFVGDPNRVRRAVRARCKRETKSIEHRVIAFQGMWRDRHEPVTLIGKCAQLRNAWAENIFLGHFWVLKDIFLNFEAFAWVCSSKALLLFNSIAPFARADSNRFVLLLGCRWTAIGSRDNFFIHFVKETTQRKFYELKYKLEHFNTA